MTERDRRIREAEERLRAAEANLNSSEPLDAAPSVAPVARFTAQIVAAPSTETEFERKIREAEERVRQAEQRAGGGDYEYEGEEGVLAPPTPLASSEEYGAVLAPPTPQGLASPEVRMTGVFDRADSAFGGEAPAM